MTKEFPLKVAAGKADPATIALVDELLAQSGPEAQAAALAIIGRHGPDRRHRSEQRSCREGPFAA